MAAYKAFREPGLISDPLIQVGQDDFCDFEQRKLRYAIYWAFYENNIYRNIHGWAKSYKTQYGLYQYIRNIYNPAFRLGEFWKTHLWGGPLDTDDGKAGQSGALPIQTENEDLRPAIAQLWKWSNWAVNKDILTLHGAIFGDVGLQIMDDVERGKTYLKVIHPGIVKEVEKDPFGNVKAYQFCEQRLDPLGKKLRVEYTETAERDGDNVIFKTYLNGKPYDWTGQGTEWEEPYGFIPLVMVQHNNIGLDFGWSEFHPSREKIHEVDDLASKFHDQIRKLVDAPWLFSGVTKPVTTPTTTKTQTTGTAELNNPQPGREEMNALYGPVGATATPLVANLDIAATSAEIKEVIAELERDYPELKVDILRATGDVSGRALRIAQQPAADKVGQRRPNYDDALVRAQQMAVAIGGFRGYDGFAGFGLDSYAAGELDHTIGERPVFAEDPLDKEEQESAFWTAVNNAIKAGIPLIPYLKQRGWTDEKIKGITDDPEWQDRAAMRSLALGAQQAANANGEGRFGQNNNDNNQDNQNNRDNQDNGGSRA